MVKLCSVASLSLGRGEDQVMNNGLTGPLFERLHSMLASSLLFCQGSCTPKIGTSKRACLTYTHFVWVSITKDGHFDAVLLNAGLEI